MRRGTVWNVQSIFLLIVATSLYSAESAQLRQRSRTGPARAPFLQHAKSYEETPHVTKVVFQNGLTVLVNEFPPQPVVSIQAYVRAGYSSESPESPGIASLLGAVIYDGAGNQGTGTFRQRVQTLGGLIRRSTSFEYTLFEIVAASSQWKRALNLQAEALLNPSFDERILKIEADHVTNEARAIMDKPSEVASESLLALAFQQPRMAQLIALSDNPPLAVTSKDLSDFYKARYSPGKTTLIVSGDIRSGEVLNEIDRIYDEFTNAGAKESPMAVETGQTEFRYSAITGKGPFPRVLFGFHTMSKASRDYAAMEVLGAILGLGEGSVITSRLRDEKKVIFQQETALKSYPDFSFLTVQMVVAPKEIDRSEIETLTELELLKREGPNKTELARAVAQLERFYWKGLETATGRAEILAQFEFSGDWKRMDRYISELRKVKASDVKRVANRYLKLQKCSLLEYLPESAGPRNLSAESVLRTFEGLIEPSADQEAAKRAREVVRVPELPKNEDRFQFSEIRYPFQLASILRGPEMFVREDHTSPLIDLGIFFPGGKLAETSKNAGITDLMIHLMLGGSGEQTQSQFYRQMEILGGRVESKVADDYFGYFYSVPSRNFGVGFNLLREAIQTPDFEKGKIARQKELQSACIKESRSSVSYPEQQIHRALFGDSSYSLDSKGTEASVAAISLEALQNWYAAYVKNRKPIVVAIGDAKGTSLAREFVQHFSGSRMQSTQISNEYVSPLTKNATLAENWDKSQSLVFIAFQAPPEDDEDRYAATVLQSYAGELGRFAQELLDRNGSAFEMSAVYESRLRGGSLMIRAAADPSKEEEVLELLRGEIQKTLADPLPRLDFRSSLNAAAGAYIISNQKRARQIERIVENVLAGKGIDEYEKFETGLKDVGEEEFLGVAGRILDLDKAVILKMQGQSK